MAAETHQPESSIRTEEKSGGAIWITIDRAHKHNALARPVLAALAQAVRKAGAQEGSRYIVLTGAGDKYFAAGGDLKDLSTVRDAQGVQAMMDDACAALDAIRLCPIPVIAYLNGDAIGGGAELALACDMRLQSASARIGYIQSRLAITSAWGGGPDLFGLIGTSRAMRMMSRGELVDAERALAWGLCEAVIHDGHSGHGIEAFLKPLQSCAPQVLRGIKAQAIAARINAQWHAHRLTEQQHLTTTWLHADHWAVSDKILSKGST